MRASSDFKDGRDRTLVCAASEEIVRVHMKCCFRVCLAGPALVRRDRRSTTALTAAAAASPLYASRGAPPAPTPVQPLGVTVVHHAYEVLHEGLGRQCNSQHQLVPGQDRLRQLLARAVVGDSVPPSTQVPTVGAVETDELGRVGHPRALEGRAYRGLADVAPQHECTPLCPQASLGARTRTELVATNL